VQAWRWTFGLFTPQGTCKYHPTCSRYAIDAHPPHRYLDVLRPAGLVTEFGD